MQEVRLGPQAWVNGLDSSLRVANSKARSKFSLQFKTRQDYSLQASHELVTEWKIDQP